MADDDTPIPDVLGDRASNGREGPAGSSGLTFDEALAMHPDLQTLWNETKTAFEAMAKANDDMNAAIRADIVVPNGPELLFRTQSSFSRCLDGMLTLLNDEKDQIRVEILRMAYGQVSPHWQSLVLNLHMARIQMKKPGKVHETMLAEATALFNRVQAGG